MNTPRVTIVIPVYNGANYMREAIESALAQSYPNIEVLVVNDGSTDGGETERIAQEYGSRIRYLAKPNGGVASALNLAIEAMTGEYFSWLSHDDVYLPDKVQAQVEFLRELGSDGAAYCAFEEIDPHSAILGNSLDRPRYDDPVLAIFATVIHGCTLLIPRRCFDAVGRFNPALRSTQDNEMWLRIALGGGTFHYLPRVLVQSRQHPEQGSRTIRSHVTAREEWYRWAIDALEAAGRVARASSLGEVLLQQGQMSAFFYLLRRLRRDAGGRDAIRILGPQLPALLRESGKQALRRVPGAVRLKKKLLSGGVPVPAR